jgi:hypothetical protein
MSSIADFTATQKKFDTRTISRIVERQFENIQRIENNENTPRGNTLKYYVIFYILIFQILKRKY